MLNYNLDKESRLFLSKLIDIEDVNSPLLKDNETFLKRVELLQPVYYIQDKIEIFLREKEKFNSTKEYIDYINKEEHKILEYIQDILEKLIDNIEIKHTNICNIQKDINDEKYVGSKFLRIYFDNDIVTCINYLSPDKEKLNNISDIISQVTDCEYLRNLELTSNKLSKYHKSLVDFTLSKICSDLNKQVNKFISNKQLIAMNNSSLIYSIQPNIGILLIDSIYEELNKTFDIDIETFEIRKYSEKAEVYIKEYDNGSNKIITEKASNLDILSILSFLGNSEIDTNNLVFECNGITCRADRLIDLN